MRTSRSTARLAALAVAAAAVVAAGAGTAAAATGTSSSTSAITIGDIGSGQDGSPITIPDSGPGSTYPASISVSEVLGTVTDVNLTLEGLEHTCTEDLDFLLVGPGGQQAIAMSDMGDCSTAVTGVNITLDDDAADPLPDGSPLTSGTFRPEDNDWGSAQPDPFSAPAPDTSAAGSSLSVFDGTDPNGTWDLYVYDQYGGDSGQLAGGWSLDITTTGKTSQYPSTINVSGAPNGITDVNVTLNSVDHQYLGDIDAMLLAPTGQRIMLMSDAAGNWDVADRTFTFDDEAASTIPTGAAPASGTYKPTNEDEGDADTFAAPAPSSSGAASTLSALDGGNANGTWKLFVVDDLAGGSGDISGGWSLQISTVDPPAAPTLTSPANGSADDDGIITFSGAAQPVSTLKVFDGATPVASTTANSFGAFSVALAGVTNGSHSYTATATDGLGNTSAPSTASVVAVDTVAPGGTVRINSNNASTNRTSVSLTLAATDAAPSSGVSQMRFSNDGKSFSAFEPYAVSKAWTLTTSNGTKTVWVQFADRAGKVSATVADSIVLDTVKPKVTRTGPAAKATGVKVGRNIVATLGEAIRPGTVTRTNVYLTKAGSTKKIRAVLTYNATKHKITINPRQDLARGTTYRATVGTGIKDLAGNQLDQKRKSGLQAKRWKFTTA